MWKICCQSINIGFWDKFEEYDKKFWHRVKNACLKIEKKYCIYYNSLQWVGKRQSHGLRLHFYLVACKKIRLKYERFCRCYGAEREIEI